MKIFGQLEDATLEQLSSDPSISVQGRVWTNTTEGRAKYDNGLVKRAFLLNDDKLAIGNDVTPSNNVRLHRAGASLLQLTPGNDATAEGSSATSISALSFRIENGLAGSLPAAGQVGRSVFVTDQKVVAVDDGLVYRRIIPEISANDATAGTTITLAPVLSSVVRLTGAFSTLEMIPAGFDSQHVTLINRTGSDVVVSNDSGATPANRILTGTNANLVLKTNSALTLKYDSLTSKWQVIGQAAGAGAGGGGVPNSSVQTVTSNYTILVTDDVILADSTSAQLQITLPTPSGNLGKRLLIEKIGSRVYNQVILVGTVDGVVNPELWAPGSSVEIISTGSVWRTISTANGSFVVSSLLTPNTTAEVLIVGAVSTANVSLETLSAASATVIDNIVVKNGTVVLLKNQTVAEENGIYTVSATNIAISATATGNENIATLANGSVVNATVLSTGQRVSLRFQSIASENGIYVIGATAGTTVRDISQRHVNYQTFETVRDLTLFADWYNFPVANVSLSPTESSASHSNDMRFWKQRTYNITSFASSVWLSSGLGHEIRAPLGARAVEFEITPYGGAGAGGTTARGGASGCGALPFIVKRDIVAGQAIVIALPICSVPGTGRTGSAGLDGGTFSITSSNFSIFIPGASPATSTGVAATTTPSQIGGPLFSVSNANNSAVNGRTYFATSGGTGTGGAMGGGAGGAGIGSGGNGGNGSNAAGFLGLPGTLTAGCSWGSGGGGGGGGPASGRPGRGGFAAPGMVRITWS